MSLKKKKNTPTCREVNSWQDWCREKLTKSVVMGYSTQTHLLQPLQFHFNMFFIFAFYLWGKSQRL